MRAILTTDHRRKGGWNGGCDTTHIAAASVTPKRYPPRRMPVQSWPLVSPACELHPAAETMGA